jgi:PAS domain S-box-containing protein
MFTLKHSIVVDEPEVTCIPKWGSILRSDSTGLDPYLYVLCLHMTDWLATCSVSHSYEANGSRSRAVKRFGQIAPASTSDVKLLEELKLSKSKTIWSDLRRVESRQWWLSFSGVAVTLLLTIGIVSFSLSLIARQEEFVDSTNLAVAVRALVGIILLFDIYVIFQQLQMYRFRMRIAEREELFYLIGEHAADMIAVVTVDGQRLYNSPSYQKVLGYSPEELERTSAYEQIHPDDRQAVVTAAEETRRTGAGRRVEYRIRHKTGEWRVLESTASAVRGANGEVAKLVIVNRDITERRHLEEQLRLSQKLEAVGKLSGGIAHDFNNILGVIIGYSEALQRRISPNDEFREPVDEILKAGQRAAVLTQQLLAFSRKQVLEPKILDLNVVIADVEKMLRRLIGEDVELKIEFSGEPGVVKADRGQIEQVIMNLAVNARDGMPQGGVLKIETLSGDLTEADAKHCRYVVPGQYVILQVSDTGCGMDAEVQSHIFEPFFTTKMQGKGTGLGLATVYGVIKQSGGYIWVESEPNKGTKFKIYLPWAEGAIKEICESGPLIRKPQGARTVLVVEDEQSLRKLTCTTLRDIGFTVLEASDGPEAIQIAREAKPAAELLLTDIVMPGMSGPSLAAQLSREFPALRVLYMSGYTDGAIASHGVLDSGVVLLRKPFTRDDLAHAVEDALIGEAANVHG